MTPKEKAKEITNKFMVKNTWVASISSGKIKELCGSMSLNDSIECALVCVDEIQKLQVLRSTKLDAKFHRYSESDSYEYWQEVKQEIQKL